VPGNIEELGSEYTPKGAGERPVGKTQTRIEAGRCGEKGRWKGDLLSPTGSYRSDSLVEQTGNLIRGAISVLPLLLRP
jgi:hypothetical protein